MALIHAVFCVYGQTRACASLFPEVSGLGGKMLLVLDVGNTNTVLGVYENSAPGFAGKSTAPRLMAHWRVATVMTHTVDEYGVLFRNLFAIGKVEAEEVRGIIVSSVVPPLDSTLR